MEAKGLKILINDELSVNIERNTRERPVVEARAMYFTILKHNTNLTLKTIGETVGRDHATVLYAIRNFPAWLDQNPYLKKSYDVILEKVQEEYKRLKPKDIKRQNADLKYQLFNAKQQIKRLQKELTV
jgi:hypothetical protein